MLEVATLKQTRIGRALSGTALRDPGNIAAVAVCAFLVYNQVIRAGFPPALANVGMAIPLCVNIVLFLIRRDPARTGNAFDALIAILGTFSISFMPRAPGYGPLVVAILLAGLALWLAALVHLGRSFGIAPADRGLKTTGPYHFIRHPVYAGELLTAFAVFAAAPRVGSAAVLGIWWFFQCWRMIREERVISGYEAYRARVRWRVFPGIW